MALTPKRQGQSAPSLHDAKRYDAYLSNAREVIYQPLYDFQTYAQAGQTSLTFFQTPNGSSSKTYADTNMELPGVLPSGVNFLITAIEIDFFPAGTIETTAANSFADDMYQFGKSGWLEFNILSKNYLRMAPLMRFGSSVGLEVNAATNITSATDGSIIEYARMEGPVFEITPIRVPSNQNFNCKMVWPTAVAVSAAARVGVTLQGFMYRNAQ